MACIRCVFPNPLAPWIKRGLYAYPGEPATEIAAACAIRLYAATTKFSKVYLLFIDERETIFIDDAFALEMSLSLDCNCICVVMAGFSVEIMSISNEGCSSLYTILEMKANVMLLSVIEEISMRENHWSYCSGGTVFRISARMLSIR